jgi:hypothetical protein
VKLAQWRSRHADALRAFPELDARFADAGRASEAIAEASVTRKTVVDAFQKGIIGKVLGATDAESVVQAIGKVFAAPNGMEQLRRLVVATRDNADARQGLRKAIVEFMTGRFVGNTEAATTGLGTLKSDSFQTFVRRNVGMLRLAFSDAEVETMQRIALDLQRSNRSIASVKLPGGSNTAQDLTGGGRGSMLGRIVRSATTREGVYGGGVGYALGGPLGAIAGVVGAEVLRAMRQAGLAKVDDILADAMLNPARARALLEKLPPPGPSQSLSLLGRLYRNAAIIPTVQAATGDNAARAFDPEKRTPSAIVNVRRELETSDPPRWAAVKRDYVESVISDALNSTEPDLVPASRPDAPRVVTGAGVLVTALARETVQANLQAAMRPEEWDRSTGLIVVLRRAATLPYLDDMRALRSVLTADVHDKALPILKRLSDSPNATGDIRALVDWANGGDADQKGGALAALMLSGSEEAEKTIRELRRLSPWDKSWPILYGHLLSLAAAREDATPLPAMMPQRMPLDLSAGAVAQ